MDKVEKVIKKVDGALITVGYLLGRFAYAFRKGRSDYFHLPPRTDPREEKKA